MTTTLCGHERATWLLALRHWESSPEHAQTIAMETYPRDELCSAVKDANDPAKLAELMAGELRRRGVDAYFVPPEKPVAPISGAAMTSLLVSVWSESVIRLSYMPTDGDNRRWRGLDLPSARAALLRLMQLPEGAPTDDVLKTLEVAP